MSRSGSAVTIPPEEGRRPRRRNTTCSICTNHIWFESVYLVEPEEVPDPRLSWVLCKSCYRALLDEMSRSPVRSPLRLRIAMGLVAAERWPHAYSSRMRAYLSDRRWIVFLAVGFFVAMLLHLVLIVMVAGLK